MSAATIPSVQERALYAASVAEEYFTRESVARVVAAADTGHTSWEDALDTLAGAVCDKLTGRTRKS